MFGTGERSFNPAAKQMANYRSNTELRNLPNRMNRKTSDIRQKDPFPVVNRQEKTEGVSTLESSASMENNLKLNRSLGSERGSMGSLPELMDLNDQDFSHRLEKDPFYRMKIRAYIEESKRRLIGEPLIILCFTGKEDMRNTLKNRLAVDNQDLAKKFQIFDRVTRANKK